MARGSMAVDLEVPSRGVPMLGQDSKHPPPVDEEMMEAAWESEWQQEEEEEGGWGQEEGGDEDGVDGGDEQPPERCRDQHQGLQGGRAGGDVRSSDGARRQSFVAEPDANSAEPRDPTGGPSSWVGPVEHGGQQGTEQGSPRRDLQAGAPDGAQDRTSGETVWWTDVPRALSHVYRAFPRQRDAFEYADACNMQVRHAGVQRAGVTRWQPHRLVDGHMGLSRCGHLAAGATH